LGARIARRDVTFRVDDEGPDDLGQIREAEPGEERVVFPEGRFR